MSRTLSPRDAQSRKRPKPPKLRWRNTVLGDIDAKREYRSGIPAALAYLMSQSAAHALATRIPIWVKDQGEAVHLECGVRPLRLLLDWHSYAHDDMSRIRVKTAIGPPESELGQAEYDLLATLIHLPVSNRQLVEDLLATRDSGIWRNRLTIEDIADLTRMSPRTVKRFV